MLVKIKQLVGKEFIGKKIVQEIFLKYKEGKIEVVRVKIPLPFLKGRNEDNRVISDVDSFLVENEVSFSFFKEKNFECVGVKHMVIEKDILVFVSETYI